MDNEAERELDLQQAEQEYLQDLEVRLEQMGQLRFLSLLVIFLLAWWTSQPAASFRHDVAGFCSCDSERSRGTPPRCVRD